MERLRGSYEHGRNRRGYMNEGGRERAAEAEVWAWKHGVKIYKDEFNALENAFLGQ